MNIKENIYNIIRNYIKRYLTGNLGEIVEEEDKLICFIQKNKARKIGFTDTFFCFGVKEKDKHLAESYKLNKPICYVIEGLDFSIPVNVFGDNCEVYIKDCEFNKSVYINVSGKCTVEAVEIKSHSTLMISAIELTLQDLNLKNYYEQLDLDVFLSSMNKLEINSCTLGDKDNRININLNSENDLAISNAIITGDKVNIKAENIYYNGNNIINGEIYNKPICRTLKKD